MKSNITDVSGFSKDEQQQILKDIEKQRQDKIQELAERQKKHEQRRRKCELQEKKKFQSQMADQQTEEDERRQQKVQELKKWLRRKEEESRQKVQLEKEAMNNILEKEKRRMDRREVSEKARLIEREKRLKIAERRKTELDEQMMRSNQGRAGVTDGHASGQADNVMHRHIHHHIHYHQEGDEVDGEHQVSESEGFMDDGNFQQMDRVGLALPQKMLSQDERRRIETESENTVRLQLPAGPNAQPNQMARTIESFAPHVNAALRRSASEVQLPSQGGERGQNRYAQSVQRASGAYADSGRPRYVRHGGANQAWN